MKPATYLEIKRFAVHDGPGIRTTLFLKGCPLACVWCHNPEAISAAPELAFHSARCSRCGDCAQLCSNHTVTEEEHRIDRKNCRACGDCGRACLYDALELLGTGITPEQAAEALQQDRMFHGQTGGVTLSGGEPLLQSEFCAELLALLKNARVHCAVDTCGHVPWSAIEQVLPFTDLFLYDLKEMDPVRHRAFTGRDNRLILDNLRQLDTTGIPVEIRMIQVPHHNMSEAGLVRAADFLAPLKHITAVRLLPCHALAHSKYRAVARPDSLPDEPSPTFDQLEKSAAILRSRGLKVINPLQP